MSAFDPKRTLDGAKVTGRDCLLSASVKRWRHAPPIKIGISPDYTPGWRRISPIPMKRSWLKALPLFVVILATPLATAGGQSDAAVTFSYDHDVEFNKLKTYIWVPRPVPAGATQADYDRVRVAIDRVLAERGFREESPGDFAIAFTAVPYQHRDYTGSYESGWSSTAGLIIDIYDTSTKRAIWSARGKRELTARLTDSELNRAVELVLNRFPPAHGCDRSAGAELLERCPI
jgi:hypothetical protein